jgi:hypothetical protein
VTKAISEETEKVVNSVTRPRPVIFTRLHMIESMLPQRENETLLRARKAIIYSEDKVAEGLSYYYPLREKMKRLFGFTASDNTNSHGSGGVDWLYLREMLLCHQVHNLSDPHGLVPSTVAEDVTEDVTEGVVAVEEITAEEVQQLGEIAAREWSLLYNDNVYNKYCIGRFVRELLEIIDYNSTDHSALSREPIINAEIVKNMSMEMSMNINNNNSYNHNKKKIFIYSGHDSTLVPLLCALQSYDGMLIGYIILYSIHYLIM